MSDPYRCDACRRRRNRCEDCRAKRAAARRKTRARKQKLGLCIDCPESAIEDELRCKLHSKRNREASRASHALARAEARE